MVKSQQPDRKQLVFQESMEASQMPSYYVTLCNFFDEYEIEIVPKKKSLKFGFITAPFRY